MITITQIIGMFTGISLAMNILQAKIIKELKEEMDWIDETYSELVTLHSELMLDNASLKKEIDTYKLFNKIHIITETKNLPTRVLKVKSKSKTNKITINK